MADICISKQHNLAKEDAKSKLEQVANDLQSKFGIKHSWSADTCSLSGTGLKKGEVKVDDQQVTIEITLGMLARAMKGKIESQVSAELDKIFS